ncbi:hypothetical protein JST97_03330 [bacterium]|nr:hypothetical protein [bacterium]
MTIKVDLNLEEKRRNWLDPLGLLVLMLVASSAVAFYAYGQTLEQQIQQLDLQCASLDGRIKEGESIQKAIAKERQTLAQLDQQLQLVRSLRLDPLKFANLMCEISQVLPPDLSINALQIEPGPNHLSFQGVVEGPLPLASLASTLDGLNRSAYFDDASLQTATRQGDAFAFGLTVHFDPVAAAELRPGSQDARFREVL